MFYLDENETDDENEEVENGTTETQEENTSRETTNTAEENVKNFVNQKLRSQKVLQKMSNTKAMSVVSSLLKIIVPKLWIIILFIVAVIIIIGLIMFVLTMPGVLMGKLNSIMKGVGNELAEIFKNLASMVEGTEEFNIQDKDIIDVADYIESMGYDLYEYGFLTGKVNAAKSNKYQRELEKIKSDSADNSDGTATTGLTEAEEKKLQYMLANEAYIDNNGIGRVSEGITNIDSETIRAYLLSDNYVYCCRNFNPNLKNVFASMSNFIGSLWSTVKHLISLGKITTNDYGSGLIGIYEEDVSLQKEGKIGQQGNAYRNGVRSRYDITIDAENKTLSITSKKSNTQEDNNNSAFGLLFTQSGILDKIASDKKTIGTFTYSLDGWTARYGIPLEFLLAVHLTSMSPDLALDLATSFDTEVVVLLHKVEYSIKGGFLKAENSLTSSGDRVTYDKLKQYKENGGYGAVLAYTPSSFKSSDCGSGCKQKAIDEAKDPKVQSGEKEFSDVCSECKTFIDNTISDLQVLSLGKNETFYPYISKVTEHWFRDVYFVAPNKTKVVSNDYDYELRTKERWTSYEMNDDGTYKLYKLNDDGELTNEVYNGTTEDAEKEGIKVAKKAITKSIEDEAEGVSNAAIFGENMWSAYDVETPETEWMSLKAFIELAQAALEAAGINVNLEQMCEDLLNSDLEDLWMCIDMSAVPTQIQDAQRTETNSTIKKIFSTNKYYQYDGTQKRAEDIEKDKKATEGYRKLDNTAEDKRNPNLIGSFSVTRDSLTAFNILTNMNTFDSDSIYRDFKELIVELNYFDKEDLTQIPTSIGEWLLPETSSAGWPIKKYDKNENYYGTLIHSKADLTNLRERDDILNPIIGAGETDGNTPTAPDVEDGTTGDSNVLELATTVEKKLPEKNEQDNVINLDLVSPVAGLKAVYAADINGSGSGLQRDTLLDTAQAVWEYIVDAGKYTYGAPGTGAPYQNSSVIDCSSYVSWVLYEYGYEEFGQTTYYTGTYVSTDWAAKYGWEVIDVEAGEDCTSKLQPGDLLVRQTADKKHGHIQIIKEISPNGNVVAYDCGNDTHWANQYRNGYTSWSAFAKGTGEINGTLYGAGKIIRIEDSINKFTGFNGYEDVVTPITGEIIEAGTTEIENIETNQKENVGFIKIRAINKSDVEAYINENDENYEGYKYFYEEYETAGITDYILYIEGFDLRIVDQNLSLLNDSAIMGKTTDENGNETSTGQIANMYTREIYDSTLTKATRERLEEIQDKMEQALPVIQTSDGKIFVKAGTVLGKTYTDVGTPTSSTEEDSQEFPADAKARPGIATMEKKTDTSEDGQTYNLPNGNYIRLILRTSEDGANGTANKDTILENVEDYLEIETASSSNETKENEDEDTNEEDENAVEDLLDSQIKN